MSTHASAKPHQLSESSLFAATIQHGSPDDQIGEWLFTTTAMLAPRPTRGIADERPDTLSHWRLGDLTLTRELRSAGRQGPWVRQPRHIRRHGSVTLLRTDDERQPATLIVSPRAHLAMPALAWPLHLANQDCEVLTLFLPMDGLEGEAPMAPLPACRIDTTAGTGALLAHFMRQLARQIDHVPDDQVGLLAIATRALVVACAAPANAHVAPAVPRIASGVVERTRLVVQRHMASPDFGPPQLARVLAMSRSKLYRLLDGDGGVAHFINRERLTQAWRDLTAPGDGVSVHAIANQVGFRDHSTFSRAFRREYGCSPTEARERALRARPDAGRAGLRENGMNGPVLGF